MAALQHSTIVMLPHTYDKEDLLHQAAAQFKTLRLEALKSNPEAFASSFDDEKNFPPETWTERLTNPIARTFVAIWPMSDSHSITAQGDSLDGSWAGLLVLLGPKPVNAAVYTDQASWRMFVGRAAPTEFEERNSNPPTLAYHMVSVFVSSKARNQGLGGRLIRAAVETITNESQEMHASLAICTMGAEKRNTPAISLYKKMGFEIVAEDTYETDDGLPVDDFVMRRDIVLS